MPDAEHVPLIDLGAVHGALQGDLEAAFRRVLGSSGFTLGAEVEAFEREFADYVTSADCVGVASGTAGLTILLRAAGIGPGDEVVVPAHTFIASVLGIVHAGATPVLCDVDDATGLMDPDAAAAAISSRTAALLPVHLYGQVCDMDGLTELAERHGLALLEDAAQAHGATWQGRRAGSFGLGAAFSFYPSKNLGALGDAGAITTSAPDLAERCRQLRHLGQRAKYDHVQVGYNERLDGLQAALLRAKLPHLDAWNEERRRHAVEYRRRLEPHVRLLEERPESPCTFHLFPVRTPIRGDVAAALADAGVATGLHYSPAIHEQPAFVEAGLFEEASFPNAEAWAAEELSLPIYPGLSADQVDRVASACVTAILSDPRSAGRTVDGERNGRRVPSPAIGNGMPETAVHKEW